MPVAASRKQYRFMMAILHSRNVKEHPRGNPPKSVAEKYTAPDKEAVESKNNDRGGSWTDKHHKAHAEKQKKSKKELKKAFEEFYKGRGRAAAILVMNSDNQILLGTHKSGGLGFTGGHLEPNESYEDGALREMHEECGAAGRIVTEIYSGTLNGNDVKVYLGEIASGKPTSTDEVRNWKWYAINEIPWDKLRDVCVPPLEQFIGKRFGKSVAGMVALENLQKNVIRQRSDAVFEVTHGDALRLIGNGMFRLIRSIVKDMTDESFKEVQLDTYTLSIRKHVNDVYSGRVSDGHKIIYQFTNKSLPELTASLMSVFEWYVPEDMPLLELLQDQNLSDDAIYGGLNELIDNYKRYNIGDIYSEMETIREQMRNGMAVDLQQVEGRIMKLFDHLEDTVHEVVGKHNTLAQTVGKDIDELEAQLRELRAKVSEPEEPSTGPTTVQAFSTNPANKDAVHKQYYSYLPKPKVEILPSGKITITFSEEWQDMERENFLTDLRAKVIKRA